MNKHDWNTGLSLDQAKAILAKDQDLDADPMFIADVCKSDIVEDILRAMRIFGMKQSDLARALGKSRQYVNQILREEVNLTIESLASIASAFRWQLILRMIRPDEIMPIVPTSELVSQNTSEPCTDTSRQNYTYASSVEIGIQHPSAEIISVNDLNIPTTYNAGVNKIPFRLGASA